MKNNNYIRHTPYLRNSVAHDHDLWYTCAKWWYLQAFFSFLWNFHFWGKLWGKRAKNSPKWKITIIHLSRAMSQEQYSIWSWFLVHLCKMIISPVLFFIFSKFWFLGFCPKWQKILFVTLHISATIHHTIFI